MANAYTCSQIQETENKHQETNIKKQGACMNKPHVEHTYVNR